MLHNQNNAGTRNFNLYTIINNTPDAIWCFDAEFTLIPANKAFFQLWGANHTGGIEIGDSVFLHSSKEAVEKWQKLYYRALEGNIVFLEEIKMIDDIEFFYETNITPVYDDFDKNLIACVCIAKDVSGRKKAELATSSYGRRFKNFTFKTSHELRSPLTNIMALIELGRNEDLSLMELKELFNLLDDSARQLDIVVRELILLTSKQNIQGAAL